MRALPLLTTNVDYSRIGTVVRRDWAVPDPCLGCFLARGVFDRVIFPIQPEDEVVGDRDDMIA